MPTSLDNGRRSPRKLSAPSSLGCAVGSPRGETLGGPLGLARIGLWLRAG